MTPMWMLWKEMDADERRYYLAATESLGLNP